MYSSCNQLCLGDRPPTQVARLIGAWLHNLDERDIPSIASLGFPLQLCCITCSPTPRLGLAQWTHVVIRLQAITSPQDLQIFYKCYSFMCNAPRIFFNYKLPFMNIRMCSVIVSHSNSL